MKNKIWQWIKAIDKKIAVIVITALILIGLVHTCHKRIEENLSKQIANAGRDIAAKDQTIQKLNDIVKELQRPAQGATHFVSNHHEQGNQNVAVPITITVQALKDKKDFCDKMSALGISSVVETKNENLNCQTDFCTGQANIWVTQKGKKIIYGIIKKSVWQVSMVTGYEFVSRNLVLGASVLDWHAIIAGANVGVNVQNISSSTIGVFGGYRPEIGKYISNISVAIGVDVNIRSQVGLQALILFHIF